MSGYLSHPSLWPGVPTPKSSIHTAHQTAHISHGAKGLRTWPQRQERGKTDELKKQRRLQGQIWWFSPSAHVGSPDQKQVAQLSCSAGRPPRASTCCCPKQGPPKAQDSTGRICVFVHLQKADGCCVPFSSRHALSTQSE